MTQQSPTAQHSKSEANFLRILFFLFTAFLVGLIWSRNVFVTLDGPAHVYNAHLLGQLIFGGESVLHSFFVSNPFPVPNASGHILLMVFQSLFSPEVSEKLLLTLIVCLLTYGSRFLLQSAFQGLFFGAFLIFPFVFSYIFFLGFYNFSLGLGIMLVALGFYFSRREQGGGKFYIILFLFLAGLYFSHLVILGFTLLVIFLAELFSFLGNREFKGRHISALALVTAPWVVLSVLFLWFSPNAENEAGPDTFLRFTNLVRGRPMVALNFEREQVFADLIMAGLMFLTVFFVWNFFSGMLKGMSIGFKALLAGALLALCLYFALPDGMAGGGYLTDRLLLLFFILSIICLSSLRMPFWFGCCLILVSGISLAGRGFYFKQVTLIHSREAGELLETGKRIPENSLVLPLNFSHNWFESHFTDYVGAGNKSILLNNYEPGNNYFPLKWKTGNPAEWLGYPPGTKNCGDLSTFETENRTIDFVVFWKYKSDETDSCRKETVRKILKNFKPVYPARHQNDVLVKRMP